MKEKQDYRTKWLHLRLTEAEYKHIQKQLSKTQTRRISDYARSVLMGKPLIGTYRNKSMDDFMTEMIRLRSELNSIGNNFNQLVKRVNTYQSNESIYS